MVLCGGMAMEAGQAPPLRRFPKGEAGSECALTTEYPSLVLLLTGLETKFQFIVLLFPIVPCGGAKAESTQPIGNVTHSGRI